MISHSDLSADGAHRTLLFLLRPWYQKHIRDTKRYDTPHGAPPVAGRAWPIPMRRSPCPEQREQLPARPRPERRGRALCTVVAGWSGFAVQHHFGHRLLPYTDSHSASNPCQFSMKCAKSCSVSGLRSVCHSVSAMASSSPIW